MLYRYHTENLYYLYFVNLQQFFIHVDCFVSRKFHIVMDDRDHAKFGLIDNEARALIPLLQKNDSFFQPESTTSTTITVMPPTSIYITEYPSSSTGPYNTTTKKTRSPKPPFSLVFHITTTPNTSVDPCPEDQYCGDYGPDYYNYGTTITPGILYLLYVVSKLIFL